MPRRALILILALLAQDAMARQNVTSLKPLFIEAIKKGSAEGTLVSNDAKVMARIFGSASPILLDVKRIGSHKEVGCARLQVTTSQAGVVERDKEGKILPAKNQRMEYEINFCESGRFPIGEEG